MRKYAKNSPQTAARIIALTVVRRKVLDLCVQLARADGQVAEGESIVLTAAADYWGLHHPQLRASNPAVPVT